MIRLSPMALLLIVVGLIAVPAAEAATPVDTLGVKMLRRGAYGAARVRFARLVEEQPDLAWTHAGLSLAQCRDGRVAEARTNLEVARALDPDDQLVLFAGSCLTRVDGDHALADEMHQWAIDSSTLWFPMRDRTMDLMNQGRYGEALELMEDGIAAGWTGNNVYLLWGECQLALGEVDQARQVWVEAIMDQPRMNRGLALETLVALAEDVLQGTAVRPFHRAVVMPSAVKATLVRAEALRRLGDLDAAELQIHRPRTDPTQPIGWAVRARVQLELGAVEQARDDLETGMRSWPTHPSLLLTQAMILQREGDEDGARAALEMARTVGVPSWDHPVANDLGTMLDAGAFSR